MLRKEDLREAFNLFDPHHTGQIAPQAFQDFLNILGNQELLATVRLPSHALDFSAFTALMSQTNNNFESSSTDLTTNTATESSLNNVVGDSTSTGMAPLSVQQELPIRRAFDAMDKTGSGHVNAREMYTLVRAVLGSDALSEEEVEGIIQEGDVSGDGRLSFEEFLKLINKSTKRHHGEYFV